MNNLWQLYHKTAVGASGRVGILDIPHKLRRTPCLNMFSPRCTKSCCAISRQPEAVSNIDNTAQLTYIQRAATPANGGYQFSDTRTTLDIYSHLLTTMQKPGINALNDTFNGITVTNARQKRVQPCDTVKIFMKRKRLQTLKNKGTEKVYALCILYALRRLFQCPCFKRFWV